jgi:hypothetical protein
LDRSVAGVAAGFLSRSGPANRTRAEFVIDPYPCRDEMLTFTPGPMVELSETFFM